MPPRRPRTRSGPIPRGCAPRSRIGVRVSSNNDPTLVRKWVGVGLRTPITRSRSIPNSADAFEVRGNLRYWTLALPRSRPIRQSVKRRCSRAKADLEKATTLNRNQAGAWATLSHLYNYAPGATSNDMYLAAQHALDADEFLSSANLVLSRLFNAAYDLGQFDKAKQWCDVAGRRFPTDVRAVRCRLYLLTTKIVEARVARAWRLADSAVAMVPPGARPRERLTEDMLVAAVLARASKQQPSLADSARHVQKRSEGDATVDAARDLAFSGAFVSHAARRQGAGDQPAQTAPGCEPQSRRQSPRRSRLVLSRYRRRSPLQKCGEGAVAALPQLRKL